MLRLIFLARLLYALLGGKDFDANAACWQSLDRADEHQFVCVFDIPGQATFEIAQHWTGPSK
jgi:hypothetical protein